MALYQPEPVGPVASLEDLTKYVEQELRQIAAVFSGGAERIRLEELHAEPARPRDGEVVLADGTDWNPGSGAGFYGYRGGSWVLLG